MALSSPPRTNITCVPTKVSSSFSLTASDEELDDIQVSVRSIVPVTTITTPCYGTKPGVLILNTPFLPVLAAKLGLY